MIKIIKIFLFLLFLFNYCCSYLYISKFHMISRNGIYETAINFMNLNEILNSNDKTNKLNISFYNKNNSILFNYNTYSELDDYKYHHTYLLKNKNFFIAKYSFNIDYNKYSYLLLIKSKSIGL